MALHFPHAIRDSIHGYVRLTAAELRAIDTRTMQRLRGIAQLGLSERVYPGARHSRFEHALGTLEVVTRMFEELRGRLGIEALLRPLGVSPTLGEYEQLVAVARFLALVHDVGHAPFSHVTEDLLPGDRNHEDLTRLLVEHGELGVVARSHGANFAENLRAVLAPVSAPLPPPLEFVRALVSGAIGADRMDYLLRDSAATGVSYGIFDLDRVLHTTTIAPKSTGGVELGIHKGGVMAVEGMLWARTSMFQQVYLHRTRRILDHHLGDFLRAVLPDGRYPIDLDAYLGWSDARIHELLRIACDEPGAPGHVDARRIVRRAQHRALAHEIESEHVNSLTIWLAEWRADIAARAPAAAPISDLVLAPDRASDAALPVVQADGSVVPLMQLSTLVGRLRQLPLGRMYVAPGAGEFPWSGARARGDVAT
ncbi:MAG: HD domain-containing protein [Planctomycetota bacterium]